MAEPPHPPADAPSTLPLPRPRTAVGPSLESVSTLIPGHPMVFETGADTMPTCMAASAPSSGRSRSRSTSPVDVEPFVERALAALKSAPSVRRASLGPPAVRARVAGRLEEAGYELTPTTVRRPLADQLATLLATGAYLPAKGLRAALGGASPKDVERAVALVVSRGEGKVILRSGMETIVPASASVVAEGELAKLASKAQSLAKTLAAAAKGKKGRRLGVLRADILAEIEGLRPALEKPEAPTVVEVVRETVDPRLGLAFVPAVVRKLRTGGYEPAAALRALLDAAGASLIELRPESGLSRLGPEDLALCPPGPEGTRLSWARPLAARTS
jgi:hypothetical protein